MIFDVNWWTVLAAVFPFFLIGATLHELSHGIMGMIFGLQIKKITPYPSAIDGHFVWAKIEFFPTSLELEGWKKSLINIAPRLLNTMLIVFCILIYHLIPWTTTLWSSVIKTLLTVMVFSQLIDYFIGFVGIFYWKRRDHTDIWQFQANSGWSLLVVRIVSALSFLVFLTFALIPF